MSGAVWLYEEGIGEARAALVRAGRILVGQIERDDGGARAGAIVTGRLIATVIPRKRGIVRLDSGEEALLEPIPPKLAEGAPVLVEILREAIAEPGRPKRAKARVAPPGAKPAPGQSLLQRLRASGHEIVPCPAHEEDRLEEHGWSELLAEAISGEVGAEDAALRIFPTPAMVLIDVDGAAPPAQLGPKGAKLAALAIARMDLSGSIGIDLPTMNNKDERMIAAAQIDKYLPQPFERTAVNGFGFVQIIRRRERASLMEILRDDPVMSAAMAALRGAERFAGHSGGGGPVTITAGNTLAKLLKGRGDWLTLLGKRRGAAVTVMADGAMAPESWHVG